MSSNIFSNDFNYKVPDFIKHANIDNSAKYVFPKGLLSAVKVAIHLGQPLLITGEPGTGKTELARAVAHKFGMPEPFVFHTKTSSTAKDLFYTYDSLSHFHYVQNKENKALDLKEVEEKFIRYEALGKAIMLADQRYIVLIDEIDKAPRDLPNDILHEIDKLEFEVPEVGLTGEKSIKTLEAFRPIVIMTSNSEKNLPDAFLRRCIFFNIEFPSDDQLIKILKDKILNTEYTERQWESIIGHFNEIRNKKTRRKKPATSELIYWVNILHKNKFDVYKLDDTKGLNDQEREVLNMSYSVLAKNAEDLASIRV